jgi:hypothetical protein
MKTLMLAVPSLAATAFLFATSARAKTLDQCWGVLSRSQGDLVLTRLNDEGLCIVGKADESRVLHNCALGRGCVITGVVDFCKDQGGCVMFTHITEARK